VGLKGLFPSRRVGGLGGQLRNNDPRAIGAFGYLCRISWLKEMKPSRLLKLHCTPCIAIPSGAADSLTGASGLPLLKTQVDAASSCVSFCWTSGWCSEAPPMTPIRQTPRIQGSGLVAFIASSSSWEEGGCSSMVNSPLERSYRIQKTTRVILFSEGEHLI
jgi:hypothetical protein